VGLDGLVRSGATRTHEFREGGMAGVRLFADALRALEPKRRDYMTPVVLGRPGTVSGPPEGSENEFFEKLGRLLARCDGLGLSAIGDGDAPWNVEVAQFARRKGKVVEVHCSEAQREPIGSVIEAGASQVVHMIQGTDDDFKALAQKGVSVAVCTRSNEFFGLTAPVARMAECNVDIRIGTDNAFLGPPDLFAEARAFARVHKHSAGLSAIQILASMLRRQGINEGPPIAPREGDRPDLLILDVQGERPDRDVIVKGRPENVVAIVGTHGGKP
jgi:cytosine/adenosine deaminase-related metal-dependent hydrolase